MMTIVKVVSDTHFLHDKIIEFARPQFKSMDEMVFCIIKKWNEAIQPNDRVIHLGDFAFGNDIRKINRIIKKLNGNITLVIGNHDTALKVSNYVKHFKCVGSLTLGKYYFSHEPLHFQAINPTQLRTGGRQATINVHGHLHNGEFCSDNHINCCLDVLGIENMVTTLNCDLY